MLRARCSATVWSIAACRSLASGETKSWWIDSIGMREAAAERRLFEPVDVFRRLPVHLAMQHLDAVEPRRAASSITRSHGILRILEVPVGVSRHGQPHTRRRCIRLRLTSGCARALQQRGERRDGGTGRSASRRVSRHGRQDTPEPPSASASRRLSGSGVGRGAVCRRPVDRGQWHVAEAQVHAQLAAVVNHVARGRTTGSPRGAAS